MTIFPLRLIPDNTNIGFMRSKWLAFWFSIILTILSIITLCTQGLNMGIDFTGGIVLEIRTEKEADLSILRKALPSEQFGEVTLQNFGSSHDVIIRMSASNDTNKTLESVQQILHSIPELGSVEFRKTDVVGPQVGKELVKDGITALLLGLVAIMLYLWFRFEWQFGLGAVIALTHDAIVTLGFISVTRLECNLTTIAAILTIVGYSVNDSVVIYDRIRDNLRKYKKMPIDELINNSLNSTLSRTILTVLTTLLADLALVLLGGEVLRSFSITIFFGIIMGTYSSIYISAPLLIFFNLRKQPTVADTK